MNCQHLGKRGPCNQPTVEGSQFCRRHTKEKNRLTQYRLNDPELRERFVHHSQAEAVESVRQEIALLRSLIEERINLANNPAERISAFSQVTSALTALDKLANSMAKLEQRASLVLEKEAATKLAQDIVSILTEELQDVPDRNSIVDRISTKIAETIANTRN